MMQSLPVLFVPPASWATRGIAWATVAGAMLLTSGCAFPRKDLVGVPDPSVIRLALDADGSVRAQAPDCGPLQQKSQYHSFHGSRMSMAFGCAPYSNLANTLARPADLVQPREYSGSQADAAALAVQRYRQNEVEPLRGTQSTTLAGE